MVSYTTLTLIIKHGTQHYLVINLSVITDCANVILIFIHSVQYNIFVTNIDVSSPL